MKIKTSMPVLDLAGNQLENMTLGKVLANMLVSDQSGSNQMKLFSLAQKFHNDEEVTIDSADKQLIISSIEKTKFYTPLITGQILIFLSEIKDD